MEKGRCFLIDGFALAYRSYFAFIRNPLINSKGENTSAVYGFTLALLSILEKENPEYIAVAFDTPQPTFRHRSFSAYKATRERMPEAMAGQLPKLKELLDAMGIPQLEVEGYEADDVIGTLSKRAENHHIEAYLVSGDKDFFQLVSSLVKIYNLGVGGRGLEIYDEKGVEEKFGVAPNRVVDVLALMGDKSDNIPGVPKVGPKTAVELIKEYGNLEEVIANCKKMKSKIIAENLEKHQKEASLSKELATIDTNIPLEIDFQNLRRKEQDRGRLITLFKELEFMSLLTKQTLDESIDKHSYITIHTSQELESLLKGLEEEKEFVFHVEAGGLDPMMAKIVGISFSFGSREAFYIPANLQALNFESFLQILKPIFEEPSIRKNGHNLKYDMLVLSHYGIHLKGIEFDTMVASYLLNPSKRQHSLEALSLEYLNYRKKELTELIGKGGKQISLEQVAVEEVAKYACENADISFRLKETFLPMLREMHLYDLFQQVEMPLISVLAEMERNGVCLDLGKIEDMALLLDKSLIKLTQEIYQLAGEEFNLNSPQQVAQIIFDKLKIHESLGLKRRKTKTGFSTDMKTLEMLSEHELPRKILDYRELAKIKSTYVDALPKLINPKTGRIHTSYNQTVTATGRLSSSNPNLQNIPIRSEIGREIRKAFIPEYSSRKILSADYNQIELRIIAHLSGDDTLKASFLLGEDVHKKTASLIFGLPLEEVAPDQRSKAKTINFGLLYGMGPVRLAGELGTSMQVASQFMEVYFNNYPGVKRYLEETIKEARERGYVTTLLNRKRYLPEILSEDSQVRSNAENIAVNTPIQGTAADMIKVAMINIHRRFKEEGLKAKMIIQVHDELVFEVPEEELEVVMHVVRREMEGALKLSLPVKVDLGIGDNWHDAH